MLELFRHIECLLVKHDCVIIPDFGGFVTRYMPARLVKEELLYLPPYRSIGFNQELTHNDGLLVQSYMKVHGTDYTETLQIIANAVLQAKNELREQGATEISGVGKLMLGVNGRYEFEPYESGVVAPDFYGLDALQIKLREAQTVNKEKAKEKKQKAKAKTSMRIVRKNKRAYMLSINKNVVNYVAAAIVAIAFFFAWTAPVSNLYDGKSNMQAGVLSFFNAKSNAQAAVVPSVQSEVAASPVETAAVTETVVETELPSPHYTIVLMSRITQKNADLVIADYHAKGCTEVYQMDTKLRRIAYGKYPTIEEAEAAVKQIRQITGIPDAWVLKVK